MSLNLFYLKGKLWKWTRSKLRPAFFNERLKAAYKGIESCAEECLDGLGYSVTIRETMDRFACGVISKVVFCLDDDSGFIDYAHRAFSIKGFQGILVLLRLFAPKLALWMGIKTLPEDIDTFFRDAVERSKPKEDSFLSFLLHLRETEPDFNNDMMMAQFFIFILAGFETTSASLTYVLYLLAKNPNVQEKLREEVRNLDLNEGRSYETLNKLTYLENVINESLRLYPPVTGSLRVAERPFKLPCGAVLPAGTQVSFHMNVLHRDPMFYPNPDQFIPECWDQPHKVFYPFGLGPRLCLGMKFALIEMKVLISSLILKFKIKVNKNTADPLEFDPTRFLYNTKTPIFLDFERITKG